MKITVSKDQFISKMLETTNKFSSEGLSLLYDDLTTFEKETGVEFEFDPVKLSRDYGECDTGEIIQMFSLLKNLGFYQVKKFLEDERHLVGVTSQRKFVVGEMY